MSSGVVGSGDSSLLLSQWLWPGHKGWNKWGERERRLAWKFRILCTEKMPPCALSMPEILLNGDNIFVAYSFCSSFSWWQPSSRCCWGVRDPRLKEKNEDSKNWGLIFVWTALWPDLLTINLEADWLCLLLNTAQGNVQKQGCPLKNNVLGFVIWNV